jgi:hypothetical protein
MKLFKSARAQLVYACAVLGCGIAAAAALAHDGTVQLSMGACTGPNGNVPVTVTGLFQNFPSGTQVVTVHTRQLNGSTWSPWSDVNKTFEGPNGKVILTVTTVGSAATTLQAYISWMADGGKQTDYVAVNTSSCVSVQPTPTPPVATPTPTPPVMTPTPTPPVATPTPTPPPPPTPKARKVPFHATIRYHNPDPVRVQMSAAGLKAWITVTHPGILHGLQSFRVHFRGGKIIRHSVRWHIARRIGRHGRMVGARAVTARHPGYGIYSWTTRGVIMRTYLFDIGHWSRPGAWGDYVVVADGKALVAA